MSIISSSTTSTTAYKVTADTTGTLVLQTGSTPTTAVTIDTSQRVGVGTSSPNRTVEIAAGTTGPALRLTNTNSNSGVELITSSGTYSWLLGAQYNVNGAFEITPSTALGGTTFSTPTAVFTQSGNVGIGTTSPVTRLSIDNARSDTAGTGWLTWTSAGNTGARWGQRVNTSNGYGFDFYNGSSWSNYVNIDSSGNLLVGATSAAVGYRTFISANTGVQLGLNAPSGQRYTAIDFRNNDTYKAGLFYDATNDRFYAQCATAGVYLANAGTSWTSASDERVKDIIEPIENATEKLSNWRTVVGKYKTDLDGVRRSFLIAQDVLATFPEAVDTSDENEYGVRYQDTIPVLVKAIQEQQAIIETLTNRITALEAK